MGGEGCGETFAVLFQQSCNFKNPRQNTILQRFYLFTYFLFFLFFFFCFFFLSDIGVFVRKVPDFLVVFLFLYLFIYHWVQVFKFLTNLYVETYGNGTKLLRHPLTIKLILLLIGCSETSAHAQTYGRGLIVDVRHMRRSEVRSQSF